MPTRTVRLAKIIALLGLTSLALTVAAVRMDTRAAGITVAYHAGWNLVGGPDGSVLNGAGSAYTLGPSDSDYQTSPSGAPISGGKGYWMYFPAGTAVTLNGVGSSSYQLAAPAGRYFMIGNPSGVQKVTVSGADQVLAYDPSAGTYNQTASLDIGQGAWAFSANGGIVTLAAIGPVQAIPTDTPTPSPTPSPTPPPTPAPVLPGLQQHGLTLTFLDCTSTQPPYQLECHFSIAGARADLVSSITPGTDAQFKPMVTPSPGSYDFCLLPASDVKTSNFSGTLPPDQFLLCIYLNPTFPAFLVRFTDPQTGSFGEALMLARATR